ncbi:MAG: lipoprotein NlpI [bacterium ADurb.Bin363]|nr:MAG: lipoprotein NlpI [bacterium ADurb.Bin363]
MSKKLIIIFIVICIISIATGVFLYFLPQERIKRHLCRGEEFIRKGNLEMAGQEAEKALEVDPKCGSAFLLLGKVYIGQKQYGLALDKLQSASEICPESAEIYYYMGIACKNKGDFQRALEKLEKASLLDSKTEHKNWREKISAEKVTTHIEYGKFLQSRGLLDKARSHFLKSVDINPSNPYPHYYLALLYIKTEQLDLALEECKNTIKLKATLGGDAFYQLARAYKDRAAGEKASEMYENFSTQLSELIQKESNIIIKKLLEEIKKFSEEELKKMENKEENKKNDSKK